MAKKTGQLISKGRESNHHSANNHERNFDMLIDGVPYRVRSTPFLFNEEIRFHILLNETSEHVFTWDSEVRMLRAIDDDASLLPAGVEEALSEKLQSQLKQSYGA